MKQNTNTTDVIFRKEQDGKILAVFPYELFNGKGNPTCYSHIGQHSSCDYHGYVLTKTTPATETEAQPLKRELENYCGYRLNIVRRMNRDRYRRAYMAINKL